MDGKRTRWIAGCALVAYGAILIRFVVFKAAPTLHIGHLYLRFSGPHTGPGNFVPFRTIWPFLNGRGNHLIAMVNLLGNIVPFVPVGFLAPFLYRRLTWPKSLLLAVLVGLLMEVMELAFRVGIFDVDDILLNAFGVIIGHGLFAVSVRQTRPA
jgi:glycopeptide antibiotics resistance protein